MRFRAKSLTSLLFAFLLALPMISVISKVIYVQSNKNAYESYYGETINQINYNDVTSFKEDDTYIFDVNSSNNNKTFSGYVYFYYTNAEFITGETNSVTNKILTNDNFFLYVSGSTFSIAIPSTGDVSYNSLMGSNFKIKLYNLTTNNFKNDLLTNLKVENVNNYSYLDNVFEYAVDEVIKENNFGNIDFFSYFTSIFMSDNQVNNRYIGYVNYYLNYALMVSLAYLLFLMLMWFINFARRFLDRGMNYDW